MDKDASVMGNISDADLPSLFSASDQAAVAAQRLYTNFIRTDLLLLVVVAGIGIWGPEQVSRFIHFIHSNSHVNDIINDLAILRAALLVFGLTLAIALATMRPDREWHEARRVAESVRSLAWRYMICNDLTDDVFLNAWQRSWRGGKSWRRR